MSVERNRRKNFKKEGKKIFQIYRHIKSDYPMLILQY